MSFAAPGLVPLALVAPIAAAAFLWLWRRRLRATAAWARPTLWPRLGVAPSGARLAAAAMLLGLAALGVALALARPRWGAAESTRAAASIEIVFVLDSSLSMGAADVAPSRLAVAKAMLRRLAGELAGHRLGLVQAEGDALVLAPLTTDAGAVDLMLDAVARDSLPRPGSRLAAALGAALELFPPGSEGHRAIVLASDGEDHGSGWDGIPERLARDGARLYALGVGTPAGAPVPLAGDGEPGYKRDGAGRPVVSRLGERRLETAARGAGGLYLRIDRAGADLEPLLAAIDRLERLPRAAEAVAAAPERFQWPLAAAAAALAAWLVLPTSRRREP